MSDAVEDRVVSMEFKNSQFESGVKTTLSTLDKLKKSLSFGKQKDGLDEVAASANKFNLGKVATGIQNVTKHFSLMRTAGLIAFATIIHQGVYKLEDAIKSFTIAPLMAGWQNYQDQINATKTILSNVKASGANLGDVTKTLNQMQKYAQLTVYNFGEMAKNVGTFTAAGVALKPAAAAIKGIANLAALSGSNSQQASSAMYQLSQAIAAGSVKLQDWNSVQNAGIGGPAFQRALAQTAVTMGTLPKNAVKLSGAMKTVKIRGEAFRSSLTAKPGKTGWLTSDVLTKTLAQFTGDMTKAQLVAQGFTKAQAKSIVALGKSALSAATQVKTWGQLSDALKEEVAGAYAAIFKTLFGDLPHATKLFSSLHNTLENLITGPIYAFNKTLKSWSKLGGRTKAIDAIKNAWAALGSILKPIKAGFREIFPPSTGKELYNITVAIDNFFKRLKMGEENSQNLKRTFAGLFAILDIGKQVIVGAVKVIGSLLGQIGQGSGGVLNFTGNIGDFLVSLDKAIKKGQGLTNFFGNLGKILSVPIMLVQSLGKFIGGLFDGFDQHDASAMSKSLGNIGDRLGEIQVFGQKIGNAFSNLGKKMQPQIKAIEAELGRLWDTIKQSFSGQNFNQILDLVNTGLLAGIAVLIKKFLSHGVNLDIGGGMLDSAKESLEALTGKMKAMQQEVKANTLLKIAAAIGIITASVVALSLIDSDKLTTALKAMAVGFAQLLGAMAILTKISGTAGFVKVPVIAASMVLLATAIGVLTLAVKNLSTLSWSELTKGLTGVAVLLAAISAASVPLSANSAGMVKAGVGITAMAVAMNILYLAVKEFSTLSWSEMIKGLAGVAGTLVAVAGAMRIMPKGMVLQGAAILEISVALNALYLAVKEFASMNWHQMAKGLAGVAGSLVAIAAAMHLMPKGMVLQAAALTVLSVALLGIGKAIANMSKMSWGQIAKGLTTLGAALVILAGAMMIMEGAVAGAAALTIASAGISALSKALQGMGNMSWGDIGKGIATLAAALAVLVVAGLALTPVIPTMLALGVASLGLGAGLALAGVGVGALAAGLGLLAREGTAGIAVILKAVDAFIVRIPDLATGLAKGIIAAVETIGRSAPEIVAMLGKILDALLKLVVLEAPKLEKAFVVLVKQALKAIRDLAPDIIQTGITIILDLLKGIDRNIGKVTTKAVDIIVHFLNAIANNIGRVVKAGANVLVKFLNGIANQISRVGKAATNIITHFISSVSNNLTRVIKAGTNMIVKFITGIGKATTRIVQAAINTITHFVNAIGSQKNVDKILDAAGNAIHHFLNGIAKAIKKYTPMFKKDGESIAMSIADGLTGGLASKAVSVGKAVGNLGSKGLSKLGSVLGIGGPSKEMEKIGRYVVQGFVKGIDGSSDDISNAFKTLGGKIDDVIKSSNDSIKKEKDSIKKLLSAKDIDEDALAKARDSLAAAQKLNDEAEGVHKKLIGKIRDDQRQLQQLANNYDKIKQQLSDARDALKQAKQDMKDAASSTADQYGGLPDISSDTTLADYEKSIADQKAAVAKYRASLKQLRSEGLDDTLYQKLLSDGTADQAFVDQLLAGGKSAVQAIDKLDAGLQTAAKGLGKDSSIALYQAGVDSAQKLVDGLVSQRDKLKTQMGKLANRIVAEIENALGLGFGKNGKARKSKTHATGQKAGEDLAKGVKDSGPKITKESWTAGKTVTKTMTNAIAKQPNAIGRNVGDGLIAGMRAKEAAVAAEAANLASIATGSTKKKLKVKSPSRVFAEIGKYSAQGLAIGMQNYSKVVQTAAANVGDDAVASIKNSLRGLSEAINSNVDVNPTITPVLDLSQVQKDASALGGLITPPPVKASVSYDNASTISASQFAAKTGSAETSQNGSSSPQVGPTFTQNNYSPKALSTADIYRKSKNLFALTAERIGAS
jgi:tape measure domain-containing protein